MVIQMQSQYTIDESLRNQSWLENFLIKQIKTYFFISQKI